MHGRDLAAAVPAGVVERELDDAPRPRDGDRLDRDAGVIVPQLAAVRLDPVDQLTGLGLALLVLDARVEVFRVLADDDQVDVVEAGADALVSLAGAHLPVEIEGLAQADVDRAETAADRRGDRALDGDAGAADRFQRPLRARVAAELNHAGGARLLQVPVELDAGRLETPAGGLGQLGAGAVARDQGDFVRHGPGGYRSFG